MLFARRAGVCALVFVSTSWCSTHGAWAQDSPKPDASEGPEVDPALDAARKKAQSLQSAGDPAAAYAAYSELREKFKGSLSAGELQELRTKLLELEYKTGSLELNPQPVGTEVFIDDKKVGNTPLTKPVRLNPGRHEVRLFKTGFDPLKEQILVKAGEKFTLVKELQREASTGELRVTVRLPPGYKLELAEEIEVIVDGKPVGSAPWSGSLGPGNHRVWITGKRFRSRPAEIAVAKGSVVDLPITATLTPGIVQVRGHGGEIRFNGGVVGQGSFEGEVAVGRYEVVVARPGFEPFGTIVEVKPGERVVVDVPAGNVSPTGVPSAESQAEPSNGGEPEDEDDDGTGLYFELAAAGLFGMNSTHQWKDDCPRVNDPVSGQRVTCDTRAPIGGALGGRLGLGLGVIGIEGFGIGAGDWSSARLNGLTFPGVPAYLSEMHVGRVGFAVGGGLRLSTPPAGLRLSLGAGGGLVFRSIYSNISSLDGSSSSSYTAPVVIGDLTLRLGGTLSFGVIVWVEFSDTVTIKPNLSNVSGLPAGVGQELEDAFGEVTVFQGTQVFIGPMLAFHFGA